MDAAGRVAYRSASRNPESVVKKSKPLTHRNRGKSSRHRAKRKALGELALLAHLFEAL